jgi:hypothetical protein
MINNDEIMVAVFNSVGYLDKEIDEVHRKQFAVKFVKDPQNKR